MRLTEAQIRRIVNESLDLDPVPYDPQYRPGEEERLKPFIKRLMELVEEEIKNCPEVKDYREYDGFGSVSISETLDAVNCLPRSSPSYIAIMRILERVWERWNTEVNETTPFPTFDELLEIEGAWYCNIHPDVAMVSNERAYLANVGYVTREESMLIRLPRLWKSLRSLEEEGRP